ncbi:MAG: DNA-3-methyladenine glycosylase family protein [Christensenellales bacterium]|jgi:N-glycosylase/DNA lyase|nr:8-oxoguanine DNA glycosylase [Clostridiales bacterium]
MRYGIQKNQITVFDTFSFNIKHILESGQIFRFSQEQENYKIIAKNMICHLKYDNQRVIIKSNDIAYAVRFFDLDRDYESIKRKLAEYEFLNEAIKFGEGIRILNQDPTETIISFILSANNNIPRIKGILNRLCQCLGEDIEGGEKAFPTIAALCSEGVDFYRRIGAGYRASYLVKTANMLKDSFDLDLYDKNTEKARKALMSLPGVGRKVADCILLFAYHKEDVFPLDTWTGRVYRDMGLPPCVNKCDKLVDIFGNLSGYAQQYLYYYYRQNKII